MGELIELVTPLHKRTTRDYLARMNDSKIECMEVARQYGVDYWDGSRRHGYGGYRYIEGYWKPVAEQLIARYGLTNESQILDVGAGKAHLLFEIHKLLPGANVQGFDVSQYGIDNAPPAIRPHLFVCAAQEDRYPFVDKFFDLVICNGVLHNLKNWEREIAYREITRVGKQAYLWVEAYRNAAEQFALECWALSCWAFMTDEEWMHEFKRNGYDGDFEFVFFE